jgi:hypothetical protein
MQYEGRFYRLVRSVFHEDPNLKAKRSKNAKLLVNKMEQFKNGVKYQQPIRKFEPTFVKSIKP